MADVSTEKFLQAYGQLLVQLWGLPPLKKRFHNEPEKVLKEFGLDPEGARVMIESPGGKAGWIPEATPESQVKLWNEGKKAGKIRFIFPENPPEDVSTQALSDKELEAISGGGNACCCCSPCCCC